MKALKRLAHLWNVIHAYDRLSFHAAHQLGHFFVLFNTKFNSIAFCSKVWRIHIEQRVVAVVALDAVNYTFQIYAAPGMDTQAIARAVRAEIENIDRQKASRGRSSMHDLS